MADEPTPETTPTPGRCIDCGAPITYPRRFVRCRRCARDHSSQGDQLHLDLEDPDA